MRATMAQKVNRATALFATFAGLVLHTGPAVQAMQPGDDPLAATSPCEPVLVFPGLPIESAAKIQDAFESTESLRDLLGDCPSMNLTCPDGTITAISMCWQWHRLACLPCNDLDSIKNQCPRQKCPSDIDWYGRADGCSGPTPDIWKPTFKASCDVHDLCYSAIGRTKAICDLEFLANLSGTCGYLYPPATLPFDICINEAEAMYLAVVVGGKESFDNDQAWAKEAKCTGF